MSDQTLDRLLMDLRLLRNQLADAERERLAYMVDRAQQGVRKQHALIRPHSARVGSSGQLTYRRRTK